jgi:hypothetical protein
MIRKWLRDARIGFIPGQSGIMRRMLREEGGWQSHLVKTSEFIQQTVKEQKPKSIRILGSGWLLDVPMKYLIENCERIILTDISHPNQIINKYSGFKNVVFETIDITGGIVDLCYSQNKRDFNCDELIYQIENINPFLFSENLIISVNLLSQLSVILTDYLTKKLNLNGSQVISIAEAIQKKHLETLPQGRSLLIADYEEEYFDEDDKFIGSKPTVYTTFPTGKERQEWIWNFDSKMMYKEDCKTTLRVAAVRL